MNPEHELSFETEKLGNIEIEKAPDGTVTRINSVKVEKGDSIILVQRHQKPESFSKEALLASAHGKEIPHNLDYVYDPSSTETSDEQERQLLEKVATAFGTFDTIAVTPRKRGSEHREILINQFPQAKHDEKTDLLLDDSGLGLIGESQFGANVYTTEETKRLFNPKLNKEARFGKGPYEGKRTPLSYMESWVHFSYMPGKGKKWEVESPENLSQRTKQVVETAKGKNFFITHEANVATFHLLAERRPEEIKEVLDGLNLPDTTKQAVSAKIETASSLMDLYSAIRTELTENPVKGYHFKNALTELLETIKLKSGTKGYQALSVYVVKDEEGSKHLFEAAYDEQL